MKATLQHFCSTSAALLQPDQLLHMIRKLEEQEQSGRQPVWLDHPGGDLVRNGKLANLMQSDGICGMTVEPVILAEAFGRAGEHMGEICDLDQEKPPPPMARKATLVEEIRALADILLPAYIGTERREGYVSLPITPAVADDTEATLAEARQLWNEIDRENLLIAVPATTAGIQGISPLIAEGINVNVTMLFTPQKYEQAALAYLDGVEKLAATSIDNASKGINMENKEGSRSYDITSIERVAGIASFSLSPVDTAVDGVISSHLNQCGFIKTYNGLEREMLRSLVGRAAIASATAAYGRFQAIFSGARWEALAALGAPKQRLLWAGITVENPAYRETKYLEALAELDTIVAISPALLAAQHSEQGEYGTFMKNDVARSRTDLSGHADNAASVLRELKKLHISLDEIAERLLSLRLRRQSDEYANALSRFPCLRS
jgi:transaldolase